MNIAEPLRDQAIPIETVRPAAKNPRRGDISAIRESLESNGQYKPIVANKRTNEILAGNHTWKAAVSLGWKEIAVSWVDVDEEAAARIILVDNRSNDLSSYSNEDLAELLDSLGSIDGTGYSQDDLDDLLANLQPAEDDEWEKAVDGLTDDREPFQQMTFILHDDQVSQVKKAIEAAKKLGEFKGENQNSNGNAIARIAEKFLEQNANGSQESGDEDEETIS